MQRLSWHKNPRVSMILLLLLLEKNNYRIHFWDINKFQAVNRMKSAEMGYWDIIKIGKNTQETVSRQKTQQEKHIKK